MGSAAVAASIAALSGVALFLSLLVLVRFRRNRRRAQLYFGAGLLLVSVTIAEEALFYVGVTPEVLLSSYVVLVAALVGVLSLGSAELSWHGWRKSLWFLYVGVVSLAMVVVAVLVPVPASVVRDGVFTGQLPPLLTAVSIAVTVPSAMLLILGSLYGAVREHRWNLLYIALGTIVISAAGALYVTAFPVSLYYAEFLGVGLLFLGFTRLPRRDPAATRGFPTPPS